MKKTSKFIALLLVLVNTMFITLRAESGESWYIIKRGGDCPKFPANYSYLTEHGCYGMDESHYANENKVLYLTFDAGYENGNIEKTLDILKRENVPGAFFILSNLLNKNTDLVKRMVNEGHTICNHTKNHKDMTKLTKEEMAANLKALEELCYQKTGYIMPKFFRYPEGHYSTDTILTAEDLGYKTFFWSMAHADWDNSNQPNPEKAIASLKSTTHPGAIILLHPTSSTNVKILGELIRWWKSEGYSFGTLDELVLHTMG